MAEFWITLPYAPSKTLLQPETVALLQGSLVQPSKAKPGDMVALGATICRGDDGRLSALTKAITATESGYLASDYADLLATNEAYALRFSQAAAVLHQDSLLHVQALENYETGLQVHSDDHIFHVMIGLGWGALVASYTTDALSDYLTPEQARSVVHDSMIALVRSVEDSAHGAINQATDGREALIMINSHLDHHSLPAGFELVLPAGPVVD